MVKMMNRELVIQELRKNPKQSRADLSKQTKLSKPTISEIVRELIEEEIIYETGYGPSTGGKKPMYLMYNTCFCYVIGTLIENDTVFFALGDMDGNIIHITQQDFSPQTEAEKMIDMIFTGITHLLEHEQVPFEKIIGIVLGVSGIKMDSNEIIESSPTIQWGNLHVREELINRLQKPVIIENDVNLMTIGEYYKGQAKDIDNFVYLFIGNGIGSGLFLNGEFYKGYHSASGEIGFMMVGNEHQKKKDLGVFETNYGLMGILYRLKKIASTVEKTYDYSILKYLQRNKHNPEIRDLLNDVIHHWALAAINIISIVDPQAIIISGELENMDYESFEQFSQTIRTYVPKMPEIKMTKLGYKAGIYGALHLALDQFHITGFKYK